jgi:hypothetical protein
MKHEGFTPGPWALSGDDPNSTDRAVYARMPKSGNPKYIARIYGEGILSRDVTARNANARLIAEAPALLAENERLEIELGKAIGYANANAVAAGIYATENERLRAALENAECDLDALKLLGHKLGSYETTRVKIRAALAAAKDGVK